MIRAIVGTETPGVTKNKEILAEKPSINIFPNPVTDQLFFQLESGVHADYDLSIHTIAGQTVFQNKLSEQINVSDLVSGIYFVRITDRLSGMSQVERVVVR